MPPLVSSPSSRVGGPQAHPGDGPPCHLRHLGRPAGQLDRLDLYTLRALEARLRRRRERWPAATNRYLLISRYTARTTGPVGTYTLAHLFRPALPPLDRVRRDRQLEEALSCPDPLHLSIMFGIQGTTAAFYAESARQRVEQPERGQGAVDERGPF
ncbi:hypothetical protein O7622_13155 [Micromonospora sp. WMMD1076]|uniref:hypothetical protein n=1 Tax=Micromonospora TaxID=1873 RepID=UPI00249B62C6|nr:hypothetical protein [Micromonospora sp. WMMD1076]WFF09427.1 hypothetical protein O7622_13155 [Micromonospora sp. WMMD1076]